MTRLIICDSCIKDIMSVTLTALRNSFGWRSMELLLEQIPQVGWMSKHSNISNHKGFPQPASLPLPRADWPSQMRNNIHLHSPVVT